MRRLVLHGATLGCTHGSSTAFLSIAPGRRAGALVATVRDHASLMNIAPFGLCSSLSNPRVAAATAASRGDLTPQFCVPHTPGPWTQSDPATEVDGVEALHEGATCRCAWGGRISVKSSEVSASDERSNASDDRSNASL